MYMNDIVPLLLFFLGCGALLVFLVGPIILIVLVSQVKAAQRDILRQIDLLRQAVLFSRGAAGKAEKGATVPEEKQSMRQETEPPHKPAASAVAEPAMRTTHPASPPPPPPPKAEAPPAAPSATPTPVLERKETPPKPSTIFQPPPPRPAPEPSAFEKGVGEVLGKMWSWIFVGEEHRPKNVSMEYAVASTWLLRASIVILVTGVGFLLKYSIDNAWIGPMGRVTLSFIAGVGMLATGLWMSGKRYHVIGQGLLGGGIATLYFSVFASFAMYKFLDAPAAFALMIFVTIVACAIAVRQNALLVAVLVLIGAYSTPVMLSTGHKDFVGLFSYMLVLGAGLLGIAKYKNWKLLNGLSFLATYVLFFGSMDKFYAGKEDFPVVMGFLAAFFILFSLIPLIYNVFQKSKATVLELVGMLANTGFYFATASILTLRLYERKWLAIISVALAAYFVLQITLFLQRKTKDKNLLIIMTGFAAFFITMTFPLLLTAEWITAAWSVQAFLFMWMAQRLGSNFLRTVAYLVYALTLGRLAAFDLGPNLSHGIATTTAHYLDGLTSRFASFGVLILSMAASHRLLKRKSDDKEPEPGIVDPVNNTSDLFALGTAGTLFLCGGLALLFVYLHFEAYWFFHSFYPPGTMTALTFISLTALVLMFQRASSTSKEITALTHVGFALAILLVLKILFVDALSFWHLSYGPGSSSVTVFDLFDLGRLFSAGVVYHDGYALESALMRLLDFCPAVAALYFAFMVLKRKGEEASTLFFVLSISLLFIYLSLEVNTLLAWKLPQARAGGVSVLWGLFAASFVLGGILKNSTPLRYAGLALFLVVVLKVFMSDLSRLDQLYRIVAFLVLGLVVLGGAVIYVRFKESFTTSGAAGEVSDKEKK